MELQQPTFCMALDLNNNVYNLIPAMHCYYDEREIPQQVIQKLVGETIYENSSFIRYTWELHSIEEMPGACRST